MDNEFINSMYEKINKKFILYKYLLIVLKIFLAITIIYIIFLFIKNLTNNYNSSINQIKTQINIGIVEKPIIQVNDKNNNLTYIISDNAIIKGNYREITLQNVIIKNDFVNGKSKNVIFNNDNDELLLKDRPEIIFYNSR